MTRRPLRRFFGLVALSLATVALAAPIASAVPRDPSDGRSAVPTDPGDVRTPVPVDPSDGRTAVPVDPSDGRTAVPIDPGDGTRQQQPRRPSAQKPKKTKRTARPGRNCPRRGTQVAPSGCRIG